MKGFPAPHPSPPAGEGEKERRWRIFTVIAAILGGAADPVTAQQWLVKPDANVELSYDDNVRMTTEEAEGSFVASARAGVRAIRSTETSSVALAARLSLNNFTVASDLDNTNAFLGLDSAYKGERNRLGLNLAFDTQSTLTSEEATTGLTQVNKQRYQLRVGPSWTYLLSERASVGLGLSYTDVFYEDVGAVPLYNYRFGTVNLNATYDLTERARLTGSLDFGRYEAQGVANEYDNVGARIGGSYLLSETMSLSFLVGLRRTDSSLEDPGGGVVSESSTGPLYQLSFSKRFDRGGGFNVQAVRQLAPSGSAEVLDTTGLSMGLSYPFSERWSLSADLKGYRNRQPGQEAGLTDRETVNAILRMAYALSEDWRLSAGLGHRWQQRDEGRGSAHSNTVFLTLAWTRPWRL